MLLSIKESGLFTNTALVTGAFAYVDFVSVFSPCNLLF